MKLVATDMGKPPLASLATLQINVLRNNFAPTFANTNYDITINETTPVGTSVLKVKATDRDGVSRQNFHFLFLFPPLSCSADGMLLLISL